MTSPMELPQETGSQGPDGLPAQPLKPEPPVDYTGTPTTLVDPAASALKQCWDAVNSNPDDFAAWEALIRCVESVPNGLNQETPAQCQSSLREAYDRFLARFPLCFGYWKKYADDELAFAGPDAAEKIFDRGVSAIFNSVDLWTQYCSFKMEHFRDDVEGIRQLFRRGAECVGLDFLAHLFWDKCIEFEESQGENSQVLSVLERIIRIPMHQYARFFEKYTHVYSARPLAEVIGAGQLAAIEAQVREANSDKSDAEIDQQVRLRVHEIKSEIYTRTQAETLKRWPFESEIKRPYFHVRPMDDSQLANWVKYLEFEETNAVEKQVEKENTAAAAGLDGAAPSADEYEPKADRVQVLYERCLVACALYEDYWDRYAKYLIGQGRVEDAYRVYERALSVHIGPKKSTLRLVYALVLEKDGKVEEARDVYRALMKNLPGHVESVARFAHLERRQSKQHYEAADAVIREALSLETLDAPGRGFLYAQLANISWRNLSKGAVAEARKIFREGVEAVPNSKYLWVNYLNFEMAHTTKATEDHVQEVFDLLRATSGFPEETLKEFGKRNLDFLLERGATAAHYLDVERELFSPTTRAQAAMAAAASAAAAAAASKKRTAEEEETAVGEGEGNKRAKKDENSENTEITKNAEEKEMMVGDCEANERAKNDEDSENTENAEMNHQVGVSV